MKHHLAAALALGFFVVPLAAQAAETTAVLDVHHAGCVLCGPIIKSTLAHVQGVKAVQVTQPNADGDLTATVIYDDTQVTIAALIKATTDRGYPAGLAKTASKS
ncbi:MAG: mercury transporter [Rhodospirillales bacterium]|jgi:copper chaperone CopZ|nr:mercury transporter [Rhodospirillales bacterium]